jgi:spore maturation protein CgeB
MTYHCLAITSHHPSFGDYSYYQDWETGLLTHPQLQTTILDIQSLATLGKGAGLVGRYDLILFLHSTFMSLVNTKRLPLLKAVLLKVRGPRVFFLGNEFRALNAMTAMAASLGARSIVSQLNRDDAELLYQPLWSGRILCLPYGFTTALFTPTSPPPERPIDIAFRGDYYPAYVGHDDRDLLLDQLNGLLRERYPQVKADIQVGERLDTRAWAAFLNQCRALVGHEAGATRIDHDENIRHFLNAQKGRLTPDAFRQLVLTMREVGVFAGKPSGRIAAPRNFEAMATKTLQILLPGRYNDALQAGVHYVELQRDFGNLDQVIETLFDPSAYATIVERAYADALAHHTYEQRINTLLHHILD